MWIISNIILGLMALSLIYFYHRNQAESVFILSAMSYVCAPLINWKNTTFNSGYIITGLLVLFCLIDLYRKRIHFSILLLCFLLYHGLYFIIILAATFINGVFNKTTISVFIGLLQSFAAIVALSLQAQKLGEEQILRRALWKSVICIVSINLCIGFFQIICLEGGYQLTYILYTGQNRSGIIQTMYDMGFFYRLFGSSYTPVITASFFLFSTVLAFAWMMKAPRVKLWHLVVFSVVFAACLLTFSKTLVLGAWIMLVMAVLFVIIEKGRSFYKNRTAALALLKRIATVTISAALAFVICTVACAPTPLRGQTNYYFGSILSAPLSALNSRYGESLDNVQVLKEEFKSEDDIESSINTPKEITKKDMSATLAVFLAHPIIGIGPAPVWGEFMGDSEIYSILHNGGILLMLATLLFYGWLWVCFFINKDYLRNLLFISIALCCISLPVLHYNIVVPFFAYCYSFSDKNLLFFKPKEGFPL